MLPVDGKLRQTLLLLLLLLLLLEAHNGSCGLYKVGDLNAWGPPPPSNPQLYSFWSLHHNFSIGDSLLFLYPPSQDSLIQVTERAFTTCNLSDPVLKMDDGNSVFNITAPGYFYFTSGVPARCPEYQKLAIAVPSANGSYLTPPVGPGAASGLPADGPSYPVVFGPSAAQGSGSAPCYHRLVDVAAAAGVAIGGAVLCLF